MPLQPPLQPAKVAPPEGTAVSETELPVGKLAKQLSPHVIPLGLLVTVPAPVPDFVTVKRAVLTAALKMAATVELGVAVQGPVPEQPPPLHPANEEPAAGAGVNVTGAPASNCAVQVPPQSMPAGVDVTVPLPVPCFWTVTVNVRTSVTVTLAGVPAVRSTVWLPENTFLPAAFNPAT